MSGISGHMAAGIVEAAEINSIWATGYTEDPEEYTVCSDFTQKKIRGEKGKHFQGKMPMHFAMGLRLIHRSREIYCPQLFLQIILMRQYTGKLCGWDTDVFERGDLGCLPENFNKM